MGIGEGGATGGQSVDIRGLGQWVTSKVADPVILVVDGDEEDVGLLCRMQLGCPNEK